MKVRFVLLIAGAITTAPNAHAQANPPMHHERPDSAAHAQMMTTLNLTDAQKTQIDAIHAKYHARMRGSHDPAETAKMRPPRGMDSTMAPAMAEVRAVLTPDQRVRFDSMVAEHRKSHRMGDSVSQGNMKKPPS